MGIACRASGFRKRLHHNPLGVPLKWTVNCLIVRLHKTRDTWVVFVIFSTVGLCQHLNQVVYFAFLAAHDRDLGGGQKTHRENHDDYVFLPKPELPMGAIDPHGGFGGSASSRASRSRHCGTSHPPGPSGRAAFLPCCRGRSRGCGSRHGRSHGQGCALFSRDRSAPFL